MLVSATTTTRAAQDLCEALRIYFAETVRLRQQPGAKKSQQQALLQVRLGLDNMEPRTMTEAPADRENDS